MTWALRAAARRELLLRACRRSPAVFIEFALRHERTGKPVRNAPHHLEWHAYLDAHRRAVLWAPVEHGKAVPLDTPIPTPSGFRPIADLVDGDEVFARDGSVCRIERAHAPLLGERVFELTFDDGAKARASADHLWVAWTQYDLDEGRPPRVVRTVDIAEKVRHRAGYWWKIPVAGPAQYPERELPVAPYVLGAWLGNGDSTRGVLTAYEPDRFVLDRCVALEGGFCGKLRRDPRNERVLRCTLGSARSPNGPLLGRLRSLGVLGNKHIPSAYLCASEAQRRELLAGLLDTDGSVCSSRGQSRVEFGVTNERLATGALELIRSLGFKATIVEGDATIDGRFISRVWRVTFTAREPVFRLPRKLAKQKLEPGRGTSTRRAIVDVREVESVPVRCLTVSSNDGTFLMGRDYTVTHNTFSVAVGRTLWLLGTDPSRRLALISNTATQAQKLLGSIKAHIETNPLVREVFPDLRQSPSDSDPWNASSITVARSTIAKDPSIQALGVTGPVVGSRLDGVILDDVLDFENTRTPEQMTRLEDWFDSTLLPRLTEEGFVHFVNTPWHQDDLGHRIAKRPGWASRRYSAVVNADDPPEEWRPLWPEAFSRERLLDVYAGTTPTNFARKYLCVVRQSRDSRFLQSWLDGMVDAGKGWGPYRRAPTSSGKLWPCFTGVDLGVGESSEDALTCLFTVALEPAGKRRRVVLEVQSGRWPAPEILQRMFDVHARYSSHFLVESNAAQRFLVQFASDRHLPVRPFFTGKNKYDERFGVESLAVEMRNGLWVVPSGPSGGEVSDEVREWFREMAFYSPEAHTGDRLMASWFAREGARQFAPNVFGQQNVQAR